MTSTTARRVEKEWRSSALAGMTSTPPGNRARSASIALGRSAVELVPGHQLLNAVRLLLLLEPVRVRAVLDLRLLIVLERAGENWRYALEPVTGRKHQLRVHMAALGAPIRNDPLYPELLPEGDADYTRPLQLLARALAFVDPLTGVERRFESRFAL